MKNDYIFLELSLKFVENSSLTTQKEIAGLIQVGHFFLTDDKKL